MTAARFLHSAAQLLNGDVLITGGSVGGSATLSSAELFTMGESFHHGPDLAVENVSFTPQSVEPDSNLTISFRVRNIGDVFTWKSRADLRMSSDSIITSNDVGLIPLEIDIPPLFPVQCLIMQAASGFRTLCLPVTTTSEFGRTRIEFKAKPAGPMTSGFPPRGLRCWAQADRCCGSAPQAGRWGRIAA